MARKKGGAIPIGRHPPKSLLADEEKIQRGLGRRTNNKNERQKASSAGACIIHCVYWGHKLGGLKKPLWLSTNLPHPPCVCLGQ